MELNLLCKLLLFKWLAYSSSSSAANRPMAAVAVAWNIVSSDRLCNSGVFSSFSQTFLSLSHTMSFSAMLGKGGAYRCLHVRGTASNAPSPKHRVLCASDHSLDQVEKLPWSSLLSVCCEQELDVSTCSVSCWDHEELFSPLRSVRVMNYVITH